MTIPHLCLWSPSVLPRPLDWASDVSIAGYTFDHVHDVDFQPPKSLECFLETNRPVLAISFGSASVPNATALMSIVFAAIEKIGARAIVCLNRSKINALSTPNYIYLVDQIPHAWLVPRVQGFIHHGGAGHTSIGLKSGTPMLIIPFFLDQNFWAAKMQELHLGPPALDYRTLTTHDLVLSLKDLLSPLYQQSCRELANRICSERDGADLVAETMSRLRCSKEKPDCEIISGLKASWKHAESGVHLSGAAAACLASHNILHWADLDPESGLDWALRSPKMSTDWTIILNKLTEVLYSIITIVYAVLEWLLTPWAKNVTVDTQSLRMRDPVRQARIRQGQYDLQFIAQHSTNSENGKNIDQSIMINWHLLSTARFHDKFTNRKVNGHA